MAHHHHQSQVSGRRLALATWLNIFITLGQAVGGWLSGSLALLADALHNFSDVVALVVTYIARRLSNRASTPQQTFGYKRAEIIAAFINASSLLLIAVFIGRSAFLRLFGETPPIISEWVIGLALGSILVNGGSVWLLHAGKRESLNLRAAYLHLFTDLLTSIAVLIGDW
jgi:cobalt-zinc-cadmium efflux system protein